jgi:NAD(P)-dependent dehydrogenase (short-subunit alcohol dehydrogenase family)
VVVAARRADALEDLAPECQAAGGQALGVPTDVTDEPAVAALARRAVERFGRIDIWVNNAGVYLLGSLEATPPEAFRRSVRTTTPPQPQARSPGGHLAGRQGGDPL